MTSVIDGTRIPAKGSTCGSRRYALAIYPKFDRLEGFTFGSLQFSSDSDDI
jgi:hypothetical protein